LLKKDGYNDAVVLVSPNSKVIVAKMEPENSAIEISVIDALSGQPIADAPIHCINTNGKTKGETFFGSTNNLGKCKNKLDPGQYAFTVKKLGYFEKSANLNTLSGQKKLEIKLIIQ
jgi:5-hydroxyisourate hydrolase-like protein (transthyretin family)